MKKGYKVVNSSLQTIFKSSLIVFIGIALSKILAYVFRIIIARYYGPEEYGLYLLALMVIGWLGTFATLGLTEGVLRYISMFRGKNEHGKIRYLLSYTVIITSIIGFLAAIFLFFLSDFISINIFHNPGLILYLQVFSILIPIGILGNILLSTIRAFEKVSWYSFIFNIFQNVVKVLFLLILIFAGFKNGAVMFSQFFTSIAVLLIGYFVLKFSVSLPKKTKEKDFDKIFLRNEIFSYSWPIMFYGIMASVLYWTDSFFIGYFLDASSVGIYNVALSLATLLAFAPELFMQLFFPLINKEHARKRTTAIREISKQVGKWIFIINLPLFILVMLFPGALIKILFGSQYLIATNALRILAVGTFFSSMFVVSNNLLNMLGRSKLLLMNTLIVGIFNIIFDFILIQIYGINGAAIATTCSFILLGILLAAETKHYISFIPFRRKMLRILIVAIIPTILLVIAHNLIKITFFSMIYLSILFGILYIVLIFATKCFDENDLTIIKTVKNKMKQYTFFGYSPFA